MPVWSPTWVIDGRGPARTPQPHERETWLKRRSTAWARLLFPLPTAGPWRGGEYGFVPYPGNAARRETGVTLKMGGVTYWYAE